MGEYYHVSNPKFRSNISKHGLVPQIDESYICHYNKSDEDKSDLIPYVFLSKINDYDSTYDDDIYKVILTKEQEDLLEIDENINNGFYKLKVTVPYESITLIYKGTGRSKF